MNADIRAIGPTARTLRLALRSGQGAVGIDRGRRAPRARLGLRLTPMRRHPCDEFIGRAIHPPADDPPTRSGHPFDPAVDDDCQIQPFVVAIGTDRCPHLTNDARPVQFHIVVNQSVGRCSGYPQEGANGAGLAVVAACTWRSAAGVLLIMWRWARGAAPQRCGDPR